MKHEAFDHDLPCLCDHGYPNLFMISDLQPGENLVGKIQGTANGAEIRGDEQSESFNRPAVTIRRNFGFVPRRTNALSLCPIVGAVAFGSRIVAVGTHKQSRGTTGRKGPHRDGVPKLLVNE